MWWTWYRLDMVSSMLMSIECDALPRLVEVANLVTKMTKLKQLMDAGCKEWKGIGR